MRKKDIQEVEISPEERAAVAEELKAAASLSAHSGAQCLVQLGTASEKIFPAIAAIFRRSLHHLDYSEEDIGHMHASIHVGVSADESSETKMQKNSIKIYLSNTDLTSPAIFLYTLGHELGHHQFFKDESSKMHRFESGADGAKVKYQAMKSAAKNTYSKQQKTSIRQRRIQLLHRVELEADAIAVMLFGRQVLEARAQEHASNPLMRLHEKMGLGESDTHPDEARRDRWTMAIQAAKEKAAARNPHVK